jgi:AcrR family transcriptional regulator
MGLREKLIATALAEIEENGSGAVSLRGFARKAGVSEAAPYRHFASKGELLGAVAAEGFRMIRKELEPLLASPAPTKADTFAVFRAFADGHAILYDLMHRLDPGESTPVTDHLVEALAAFEVLVGIVARTLPIGDQKEAARTAFAWWSEFHGRVIISRAGLVPPELQGVV